MARTRKVTGKQAPCMITMCVYAPNGGGGGGNNNNQNLDFKLDMTHTKYNDHRQLFEHGSATRRKKRNSDDDDLLQLLFANIFFVLFSSFASPEFCDGMQIGFDHWPSINRVIKSRNEEKNVFSNRNIREKSH